MINIVTVFHDAGAADIIVSLIKHNLNSANWSIFAKKTLPLGISR